MASLAIDACAALHSKQADALFVLDRVIAGGARPLLSNGVFGEAVAMSLRDWLSRHGVEPMRVRREEVKAVRSRCAPRRLPGTKDLELVALAKSVGAILLSHDELACVAGRRVGLCVVDLCDLTAYLHRLGSIDAAQLATVSARLHAMAWKSADWKGDVSRTIAGRTRAVATQRALDAWLEVLPVDASVPPESDDEAAPEPDPGDSDELEVEPD